MTTAHPLAWPVGWPRHTTRKRATFGQSDRRVGQTWRSIGRLSVYEAYKRLSLELERLGARDVVLSTNLELRNDGQPRSNQPEPRDTGAACYFKHDGRPLVLACDKWDRVADNIAAIAKHIDAMRGMDRWGVGSLARAFTGYTALPPASPSNRPWREVIGTQDAGPKAEQLTLAETAYRRMAREHHPDNGGSHERMAELNAAIEEARRELR